VIVNRFTASPTLLSARRTVETTPEVVTSCAAVKVFAALVEAAPMSLGAIASACPVAWLAL
jgi:hypothetical protein